MKRMFGDKGGVHIGCLFHLKQAWRKYLVEKIKMPSDDVIKEAMKVGGLDLLCILPRDEVTEYGIPYLRAILENGQPTSVTDGWVTFWAYFTTQWLPILSSWNICGEDGSYIEMVNRTNNGVESYNRRINDLFKKTPTMIEFVKILEEESRYQSSRRINIMLDREVDPSKLRAAPVPIPTIPEACHRYKEKLARKKKRDSKKKMTTTGTEAVKASKKTTTGTEAVKKASKKK